MSNGQEEIDDLIAWQCRLRAMAMRRGGGRPLPGMCPVVCLAGVERGRIVVILNRRPEMDETPTLRFLIERSQDPARRLADVSAFLAERYYQKPSWFSSGLTATFASDSVLADELLAAGSCRLHFADGGRESRVSCRVREAGSAEQLYQATWWHNRAFNDRLTPDLRVLVLTPAAGD